MEKYFKLWGVIIYLLIINNTTNAQWKIINGSENLFTCSLAASGDILYVVTSDKRILYSLDKGQIWEDMDNSSITANFLLKVAVKGDSIFVGTDNGLYFSTNNGADWQQDMPGQKISSLAWQEDTLYAVVGSELKKLSPTGWIIDSPNGYVCSVFPSKTCVFATAIRGSLYRKLNGATDWEKVLDEKEVGSVAIRGTEVYAAATNGLYYSNDQGQSWEYKPYINLFLYNANAIHSLVISGDYIYMTSEEAGLCISTNKGESWSSSVNTGANNDNAREIVFVEDEIFVAYWGSGIYHSSDFGLNWERTNYSLEYGVSSTGFLNSTIFATTNCDWSQSRSLLYMSKNYGLTWQLAKLELNQPNITSVLVKDSIVFAGTTDNGMYRSTDGGENWQEINNGLIDTTIITLVEIDSNIYVATKGGGFYVSSNDGMSWQSIDSGLMNSEVLSVAKMGDKLFVGINGFTGGHSIYSSSNDGQTWSESGLGIPEYFDVRALSVLGDTVFAGTSRGIYCSNDGAYWDATGYEHYAENCIVNSFVDINGELYVGSSNDVWHSTDNGVVWGRCGFRYKYIYNIYSKNDTLFAATADGLYYCPVQNIITDVKETTNNITKDYLLNQNYPNPFNPNTTISFSIPKNEFVTLKIYDIIGREVAELVNKELTAGSHKIDWNAANLSSGVYFYRIQAGKFAETRKLMLLK